MGSVPGGPEGADADPDVAADAHYYVEDFEDGTLTSSEGRTDRRPLLAYSGRPDGGMPEGDLAPAIDARMKDGPRRNQGGTVIVEEASPTLKSRAAAGGTGVGARTTDVEQPLVVEPASEEAATLSSGSAPNSNDPGRRREDDQNLVVEAEPQTFDWQLSGGGADESFRGKGRAWIEDKPGTARALTKNKTLAVHVPAGATGLDRRNQADTGDVSPTLTGLAPGDGSAAGEPIPVVVIPEEPMVFTKTHGAQDAEADPELWAEADVARPLDSLQHARDVVVEPKVIASVRAAGSGTSNGLGVSDGDASLGLDTTGSAAVAFQVAGNDFSEGEPDGSPTLRSGADKQNTAPMVRRAGAAVRRLTPTECERLQGFPDGWTDLGGTSDGPRYAALGDAVSVPVPCWIMRRLAKKWAGVGA